MSAVRTCKEMEVRDTQGTCKNGVPLTPDTGIELPGALWTQKIVPVLWCVEGLVALCAPPRLGVSLFRLWFQRCPPVQRPQHPKSCPGPPPRAGQARREALDPLLAKQEYRARHGDTAPQPRGGTRPGPAGHGGYGINSHVWPRARKPPNSRGLGGHRVQLPTLPQSGVFQGHPMHGDPVPAAAEGCRVG